MSISKITSKVICCHSPYSKSGKSSATLFIDTKDNLKWDHSGLHLISEVGQTGEFGHNTYAIAITFPDKTPTYVLHLAARPVGGSGHGSKHLKLMAETFPLPAPQGSV